MRNKPQRSCLGCGSTQDKENLLRFVIGPDNTLIPDLKAKLPGRGAYTCTNRGCLALAVKKKRFNSSFKAPVAGVDPEQLSEKISTLVTEQIKGYLSLAAKAGKVFSGSDAVADGVRSGKAGIVFAATDLSDESRKKFRAMADTAGIELVELFGKDSLGMMIGKEYRGVVAVEPGGFIAAIRRDLQIYRNFFDGEV